MEEPNYDAKTVAIIEPATIVTIEISGYFLQRLQAHLINRMSKLTEEERVGMIARIKEGKESLTSEEDEIHIFTSILKATQLAAKEQNKLTYKSPNELKALFEQSLSES